MLASELLEAGQQVHILSRKVPERLPEGVRYVKGDIDTGEALKLLLRVQTPLLTLLES
jgi:hypothetical protein